MEHWAAKVNPLPQDQSPQSPVSTMSASYASLYNRNEPYVREVIKASRTVLQHVLDDLLPGDHLKHAPVRTYFRIISAAMFLLKVNESFPPIIICASHNPSRLSPSAGRKTKCRFRCAF